MKREDSNAFATMLQAVAEHVSTGREPRPLSSDQVIFYFEGLKHYDLEAIRAALNLHVRNPDVGQFMPKIADLIRSLEGSQTDSAARACAVISDMGGWPSLFVDERETPFRQREFETRYRGYAIRGGAATWPRHLPGIAEAHNVAHGFGVAPPVLIGDASRAKVVLEGPGGKIFPSLNAPA